MIQIFFNRTNSTCRCGGTRTTSCLTLRTPSGCRAGATATPSSSPPSDPAWTSETTPASQKTHWEHSSEYELKPVNCFFILDGCGTREICIISKAIQYTNWLGMCTYIACLMKWIFYFVHYSKDCVRNRDTRDWNWFELKMIFTNSVHCASWNS